MQLWLEKHHKVNCVVRPSSLAKPYETSLSTISIGPCSRNDKADDVRRPKYVGSHQTKTLSQVNSSHFRIGSQLLRRAVPEDLAIVDDVRPVRNRQRLSHIVIGNQHSNPCSLHVADYFLQI